MRTQCVVSEGGADKSECGFEIAHDAFGADAQNTEARAAELQIAARIRGALAGVNGAIDFDDELATRRAEVGDELAGDGNLTAKGDAELACVERGPKARFGDGEGRAMLPSEELEPRD